MVGDMENLKVKVNNLDESKEVQELFIALGVTCGVEEITSKWVCLYNGQITFYDLLPNVDFKQITLQYLRHLVVLKRNSIDDATHYYGGSKYYLTDSEFYQYSEGKWVNIDEYVDGMTFNKIEKEVDVKTKEYLNTNYKLRNVKQTSGDSCIPKDWIEVPEGAEVLTGLKKDKYTLVFWKPLTGEVYKDGLFKSYSYHKSMSYEEYKSNWINNCVLWQRNPTTLDSVTTVTQEKLKFIEKWLNGEKIQYILGIESEKTQADKSKWHNFTEGAMQYIKRSDIKFREAPKYVTINGIEFKSVEKLLKYVKNNFDLEDGSKSNEF